MGRTPKKVGQAKKIDLDSHVSDKLNEEERRAKEEQINEMLKKKKERREKEIREKAIQLEDEMEKKLEEKEQKALKAIELTISKRQKQINKLWQEKQDQLKLLEEEKQQYEDELVLIKEGGERQRELYQKKNHEVIKTGLEKKIDKSQRKIVDIQQTQITDIANIVKKKETKQNKKVNDKYFNKNQMRIPSDNHSDNTQPSSIRGAGSKNVSGELQQLTKNPSGKNSNFSDHMNDGFESPDVKKP